MEVNSSKGSNPRFLNALLHYRILKFQIDGFPTYLDGLLAFNSPFGLTIHQSLCV
jgi:hypothetical protein